jgi:uncharacterized membrane protein
MKVYDKVIDYKDTLLSSKKYWILYLVLIVIAAISMVKPADISHPAFELATFVFIAILGVFCICYAMRHNSDDELYKTAFVVIICFGLICSLLVPICGVSDEKEHLTRAEMTSRGVIIPHWNGEEMGVTSLYNNTKGSLEDRYNEGVGYETIHSITMIGKDRNLNVFDAHHDKEKINYTLEITDSAFAQNPFFGYLPQAIGILVAKLLDLNIIWMLWLGRMFNLVFFAGVVSYAIKKTPYLKIPLLVVACIPITIYQASSTSIDGMIFALGILAVAFFIYMYKSEESSIENYEIVIFSVICLLLGLCKLTFLAFIFLLLFVPRKNFKTKSHVNLIILLCIAAVALIGIAWSHEAAPTLAHSWRSKYYPVNSTLQMNYLINHPGHTLNTFSRFLNEEILKVSGHYFNFFNSKVLPHYSDRYYLLNTAFQVFLAIVLIAYPNNTKFDLKTRIGAGLIIILVYLGTCMVQLLSFAKVGGHGLGISLRYYIPLLALIPIVFQINYGNFENREFDKYTLVISIAFMAAMVLSFAMKHY